MTDRPADLPDYGSPPVTEVVLGVQFNDIEALKAPHLGLIWQEFKNDFPEIEERPPLDPVFETFGGSGAATPPPWLQLRPLATLPLPRIFLINSDRTELLQVQRDRFYHNWRKIGDDITYPRFERMLETFKAGYDRLSGVLQREGLGAVVPNQCEIMYVNHVLRDQVSSPFEDVERIFGDLPGMVPLRDLGKPEDARLMLRYVIRTPPDSSPLGRLILAVDPARKEDGTDIIQFTLTARGKPLGDGLQGVTEFLKLGRGYIVWAFDQLTQPEMHARWEKKQ